MFQWLERWLARWPVLDEAPPEKGRTIADFVRERERPIPRLIAAPEDFGTQLVKELEASDRYLNVDSLGDSEARANPWTEKAAAERAEILEHTVGEFPLAERERLAKRLADSARLEATPEEIRQAEFYREEDGEGGARELLALQGYDADEIRVRLRRAAERCEAALDEVDPHWWMRGDQWTEDDKNRIAARRLDEINVVQKSTIVHARRVVNVGERAGNMVSRGTQEETTMDVREIEARTGRRLPGPGEAAPATAPTVAGELHRLLTHTTHAEQVATVLDDVTRQVFGCNTPTGDGLDALPPDAPMVVRLERMNDRLEAAIKLIDSAAQLLRGQLVDQPRPRG